MPKKLEKNIVLSNFNEKHINKYDYSLFVEYNGIKQIIDIICNEHGIFKQSIYKHSIGQGCPKCSGVYQPNNSEIKQKFKQIHGDKYDYSLINYIDSKTKVKIICPIHGIFEQTPNNHLKGQNCPFCSGHIMNTDYFIRKSKNIHNNKFIYDKTIFINSITKVTITCPDHGDFNQLPGSHLKGIGCSKCSGMKKLTTDEFIRKSKIINDDKYDYSLVNYINGKKKVKLICSIHGEFEQSPNLHIGHKQGCPKCAGKNRTTEDFIKLANEIHDNKYDYSLSEYKKANLKIKIICSKHGIFEQTPNHHINGQNCPICNLSKGENQIKRILEEKCLKYHRQYSFKECKFKKKLQFDFYIPNYNTCIEYDGIQHFKSIEFFGGDKTFNEIKEKDKIKTEYCFNNNIKLLRIPYFMDNEQYINEIENIL